MATIILEWASVLDKVSPHTPRAPMDNALASQAFMPLVGLQESEDTARLLTVVILIVQAVLIILSTRLLGLFTSVAVGLELAIVVVLQLYV